MLTESENSPGAERLSALMDGELERSALAQACVQWRDDPHVRSTWHAYHLIGDVLRSEDLARPPAGDAAFLNKLRARLANEPVVLAPASPDVVRVEAASAARTLPGRSPGRFRSWRGPTAVAAGFVAVAGALTLMRPGGVADRPSDQGLALVAPAGRAEPGARDVNVGLVDLAPAVPGSAEPASPVATGQFIRDARLDRYLSAHKQFAGSSALGVPSGYLRNATAEAGGR